MIQTTLKTYEQLLKEIKEFITPERYTKGAYGRDENGVCMWGTDPTACKFCFIGAAQKIIGDMNLVDAANFEEWAHAQSRAHFNGTAIQVSDAGFESFTALVDFLVTLPEAAKLTIECAPEGK